MAGAKSNSYSNSIRLQLAKLKTKYFSGFHTGIGSFLKIFFFKDFFAKVFFQKFFFSIFFNTFFFHRFSYDFWYIFTNVSYKFVYDFSFLHLSSFCLSFLHLSKLSTRKGIWNWALFVHCFNLTNWLTLVFGELASNLLVMS